jgi:SAM-dependent methyltransferase
MPEPADLARLLRLRDLFLDERGSALADYWRDDGDLAAYDAVLGARIGWKWDSALRECADRGFARADGETVLDYGCGTGVAARRFAWHFGAGEVLCHDRSAAAMAFAVERQGTDAPGVPTRSLPLIPATLAPDVLLISHVLGELDARAEASLRELITRARRVVIVEPGSRAISRRLSALRDALLGDVHVLAPCPHAAPCPTLATATDWCHFFATPPAEVFTDGGWVRTARALGIDLRALPYAFVALARQSPTSVPAVPPNRMLGRAAVRARDARLQLCTATGLETVIVEKRDDPATWRALKKAPATARQWPPAVDGT